MSDEQRECEHCGTVPDRPFTITAEWADAGERGAVELAFCDRDHWKKWHVVREITR